MCIVRKFCCDLVSVYDTGECGSIILAGIRSRAERKIKT